MNLTPLKQVAEKHRAMGWTGFVCQTDEILQLIALAEAAQRAEDLAIRANRALLDHDIELVRNFLHQIKSPGT